MNAIRSPRATSRPALRAAETPSAALETSRTGNRRAIPTVPSFEPSSTTITSSGGRVWANTDSSASAMYRSPSRTAMMTLTTESGIVDQPGQLRCRRGGIPAEIEDIRRQAACEVPHRREGLAWLVGGQEEERARSHAAEGVGGADAPRHGLPSGYEPREHKGLEGKAGAHAVGSEQPNVDCRLWVVPRDPPGDRSIDRLDSPPVALVHASHACETVGDRASSHLDEEIVV